ncbi:MAG TPA: FHA domain-containing protein [Anaerolineae bacterium]|nr:FHA domain-containing protein [Anaerolineae bacterium]
MKKCPNCGNMNEDAAMFCDNCGSPLGAGAPAANVPVGNQPPIAPQPMSGASAGGNIICPSCSTPNVPGTLYCDNCGADLRNVSAGAGMPMSSNMGQPPSQSQQPYDPALQQSAFQQQQFPPQYPPVGMAPTPPRIMAGGQPLMVPQKTEIIIGRSDAASGWMPDVDLTAAGGTADQGVSRRHARLSWQGQWMIEDMDSVNGTYIRGQKLIPAQKTALNNGEVIQLGRIQVTFYNA